MPVRRTTLTAALVAAIASLGCGLLLTDLPDGGDLFDAPLEGLTANERSAFVEGDAQFGRAFAPADGLGPIFNNVSCAACHSADGRGRLENSLTRFSIGADPAEHLGGPQIQDKAIAGAEREYLPPGVQSSLRLPPPVFGVGLIEAIPDSVILVRVDSLDADGDGISGRANFVTPPDFIPSSDPGAGPVPRVGRFSRKAQVASLLHQTVAAYHQDMGVTSDFLPVENRNPLASVAAEAADRIVDPEIPATVVRAVVNYLRMLAPPAPGLDTPERLRGSVLFDSIGCASCHVRTLQTGTHSIGALAHRAVPLYSDLLLHDMGAGLADDRSDGSADGREWRTAPLWGLRLMRRFLNGDAFLLHDGRARTFEEAIMLHGGEALAARSRFASLASQDRAALVEFVGSR